jgi:hypothetical protein
MSSTTGLCTYFSDFMKLLITRRSSIKLTELFIILNFYQSSLTTLLVFVFISISYYLIEFNIIYTNSVDRGTRFNLHEFSLNVMYYYWTNFWFILPVLFILVFYLLSIQSVATAPAFLALWFFFLPYALVLIHYWVFNSSGLTENLHKENLNPLLTNSINKYHPLIFYLSTLYLFKSYLQHKFGMANLKVSTPTSSLGQNFILENAVLWVTLTLSLGGWWALQEGSWGGWWNWDPSETFGLVLMIWYLRSIHVKATRKLVYSNLLQLKIQIITFLLIYLFIQLNFDLVSHNFGTRLHQFINSYYSYLLGLLVGLSFLFKYTQTTCKKVTNLSPFLLVTLSGTIALIILFSLLDLCINFTWLLFKINALNLDININNVIFVLISLMLITFFQTNTFTSILLFTNVVLYWPAKIILNIWLRFNLLTLPHKLTLWWIALSGLYVNQSLVRWNLSVSNPSSILLESEHSQSYLNLKLNSLYIEFSNAFLLDGRYIDAVWGFMGRGSTPTTQNFSHLLNHGLLGQALKLCHIEFSHLITVLESNAAYLPIVLITWLILLARHVNQKNLIIF